MTNVFLRAFVWMGACVRVRKCVHALERESVSIYVLPVLFINPLETQCISFFKLIVNRKRKCADFGTRLKSPICKQEGKRRKRVNFEKLVCSKYKIMNPKDK